MKLSLETGGPDMPEPTNKRVIFDRNILMPVGLVCAVVAFGVTTSRWIDGNFAAVRAEMLPLKEDIRDIKRTLAEPLWLRRDQGQWAALLAAKNPTLNIPEVR